MKRELGLLLSMCVITPVYADVLVAPGTKATLTVDYDYVAAGKVSVDNVEQIKDWNVHRAFSLNVQVSAVAQLPTPTMQPLDATQLADVSNKQARIVGMQQKMAPTMADMQKIIEKCGGMENEACITRDIANYGMNMKATPELKSAKADAAALSKQGPARYQMWQLDSQSGTYLIDEVYHKQVFEMTCTNKPGHTCKSEETRKGGGNMSSPPGGKALAGSAVLEFDSVKKDLLINLAIPPAQLGYTKTVVTSIIDDDSGGTKQSVAIGIPGNTIGLVTISVPTDVHSLSGTQTLQLKGKVGEGGTLTVKWRFTVQ